MHVLRCISDSAIRFQSTTATRRVNPSKLLILLLLSFLKCTKENYHPLSLFLKAVVRFK